MQHAVEATVPSGLAFHSGLASLGVLHHSHYAITGVVACASVRDYVLLWHFAAGPVPYVL